MIEIALSLLGAGGIAGAVGLYFIAPALLMSLLEGVGRLLAAMLRTPLGAAALAGGIAFLAGHGVAEHFASERCAAEKSAMIAAAEDARQARDTQITGEIETQYRPQLNALETKAAALQKVIDDTPKTPGACKLGPGALKLRNHK